MTSPGAVSDYDEDAQATLIASMATTLNVAPLDVSLTITAASVNLVFTFKAQTSSAAVAVAEMAATSLGSAEATSAALGIALLDDPLITLFIDKSVPPPPSLPPTPPSPPRLPPLPPAPLLPTQPQALHDAADGCIDSNSSEHSCGLPSRLSASNGSATLGHWVVVALAIVALVVLLVMVAAGYQQRWSSHKLHRQQQQPQHQAASSTTTRIDKPALGLATKIHEDPMRYKSQGKLRLSTEVALAEQKDRCNDAAVERANSRVKRKCSMHATDCGESGCSKSRPGRQVSTPRRLVQERRQVEAQALEELSTEAWAGEPRELPRELPVEDGSPSAMPLSVRAQPSLVIEELFPGPEVAVTRTREPTPTTMIARAGTPRQFTPRGFAAMTQDSLVSSLVMRRQKLTRPCNYSKRLRLPGRLPAPGTEVPLPLNPPLRSISAKTSDRPSGQYYV